jgi:hypothetical protein
MSTEVDPGRQFAEGIFKRDRSALLAVLADGVDFGGLTPRRVWEASSPTGVDDIVLGHWFQETDILETLDVTTSIVNDRNHLSYRFSGRNSDGPFVVEQQAYFDTADGRITWMRVLCSGFRPVPEPVSV